MNRVIFHVDVNSAFLSWEAADRLKHGEKQDLRSIPSVIGGSVADRRGIVLAKSIPAKKYNIQTGESLFSATEKCPNLTIIPPRYDLYALQSAAMVNILNDFSPTVQQFSIDECFLDYSGMENILGEPIAAANRLRERFKKELDFTVNIGISSNKLLAKMGGDLKKPDMVHTLYPNEIQNKMWPLPVEDLIFVGPATSRLLHRRGINTIGELANADPKLLNRWLKSNGTLIWRFANGLEDSPVRTVDTLKGIGNSTTFSFDLKTTQELRTGMLALCETVGMRLRSHMLLTSFLTVHYKTTAFSCYSHGSELYYPTSSTNEIFSAAYRIFTEGWQGEPLRAMGIRATALSPIFYEQTSLFGCEDQKLRNLDTAIDKIRQKYGPGTLHRCVFLGSPIPPLAGGVAEDASYRVSGGL